MKSMSFDAGPLISLALAGMAQYLPRLKEHFGGEFIITPEVHGEVVDTPLQSKRFTLEALRIESLVRGGTITLIDEERIRAATGRVMRIANRCYRAKGSHMKLVHIGEASAIAAASLLGSSAIVIDERTTRMMLEAPESLRQLMQKRLHTRVELDRQQLRRLQDMTRGIGIIRSAELAFIAVEKGVVDHLKLEHDTGKMLCEAALWGVKFAGCSISENEIGQAVMMLKG